MRIPWKCLPLFMQRWSAMVLLAANLVPLGGVLFAGWDAFSVVLLYWLENLIIGFFNVAKFLTVGCIGHPDQDEGTPPPHGAERVMAFLMMTFYAGFFVVHYGGFAAIHGTMITHMLAPEQVQAMPRETGLLSSLALDIVHIAWNGIRNGLALSFVALFVSHGFSFVNNFLYCGEYRRVSGSHLMGAPYVRVVVIHVAIIFAALPCHLLSSPVPMVVLLVLMKIGLDLIFHAAEHQKLAMTQSLAEKKTPDATPAGGIPTPSV